MKWIIRGILNFFSFKNSKFRGLNIAQNITFVLFSYIIAGKIKLPASCFLFPQILKENCISMLHSLIHFR